MTHWRQPHDDTPSVWRMLAAGLVAIGMLVLLFFAVRASAESPMVVVIASVCLDEHCRDIVVTTSAQDEHATMAYCGMMGPMALADWMGSNWPGYRLGGWKCIRGGRRQGA